MIVLPEAFPDEDFRSVICRYNHRRDESFSISKKDLFSQLSRYNPFFQTNLNYLNRNLPDRYTRRIEDIISQNTWYGLVRVWLSKYDQREFLKQIHEGTDYSFLVTKYLPNDLLSNSIRYCPKCMEYDWSHWGTCYIHRAHQLDFMDFCPHHNVGLVTKCTICGTALSSKIGDRMIHTPFCDKGHDLSRKYDSIDPTAQIVRIKLRLYSLIVSLRDYKYDLDPEFLHHKMISFAWKRGYIHYRGQILKAELITAIKEHYSKEILEHFNLKDQLGSKHFRNILLNPKSLKTKILFNLLLLLFFTEDFESFIKFEAQIANQIPFGSGPWACNNSICRYYRQPVITECMRVQKFSGVFCIVGEFKCIYCGCIYNKRWNPAKPDKDGYLIRDLGPFWKEKVSELYLKGYSTTQIEQMTGAIKKTVQRFLKNKYGESKKLNASEARSIKEIKGGFDEVAAATLKENLQQKRERLLEIIDQNPSASRVQLKKIDPTTYNVLIKMDQDWCKEHLPNSLHRGRNKLDFSKQDKEISQHLTKVIRNLKMNYDRQIRQSTILNCLPKLTRNRLLHRGNRFPYSREMLEQNIEGIDEFVKRALPLIIANLKEKGILKVTYSKIISYRSIIKRASNETQEYIKEITK